MKKTYIIPAVKPIALNAESLMIGTSDNRPITNSNYDSFRFTQGMSFDNEEE